jgi:hypothetical protein
MGLNIEYTIFDDYLLSNLQNMRNPRVEVKEFKKKIRKEIERQSKKPSIFVREKVPKKLKGFKFGSYGEIHFLRMYAARISGYTLEEAYDIETVDLGYSSELEEDVQVEDDEYSTEDEFKDIWGVSIEKVFKKKIRKDKPFRFKNLVCFPDNDGIYIPNDFPMPIYYRDINVGSCSHLLKELNDVSIELKNDLISAMDAKIVTFGGERRMVLN